MSKDTNPLRNAQVIPRAEHSISRKQIDPCALKVLYRLNTCGFEAFLVGGCVRDLLLDHQPKDFDIATNAKPEEVRAIFKNCRLIGRRFRLAHILFPNRHIIEVATFRGHHENTENADDGATRKGMIIRDNVYGTIEEDAWRRDFSINALYYNIKDFSIVDFTDGVKDIHNRELKIIGDAKERYQEDPVRMIRAIRIASKLDMTITKETLSPIKSMAKLIHKISSSRLFDEVIKLFHTMHAEMAFPALRTHHLFPILFPEIDSLLNDGQHEHLIDMYLAACKATDDRLKTGKTVSPAYLFAILLWPIVEEKTLQLQEKKHLAPMVAFLHAVRTTLNVQREITAIPKRLISSIQEIWYLQYRLLRLEPRQVLRSLKARRFRAGYDLLVLRSNFDPSLKKAADWWTNYQASSEETKEAMIEALSET